MRLRLCLMLFLRRNSLPLRGGDGLHPSYLLNDGRGMHSVMFSVNSMLYVKRRLAIFYVKDVTRYVTRGQHE